jgi:fermentation-respiration switch protein FrsA (DUF1100 family)
MWVNQKYFIFMPQREISQTPADHHLTFDDLYLPIDLITHQRFDSINKINRLKMPVLILHGTDDRVVPFEMSRRLYEQASSPKRLKLIMGGGHNNSARVGGAEYLNTVREFIRMVHEGI